MRRGGYYAPLRSRISHEPEAQNGVAEVQGAVTLKLFNLVAKYLGEIILQNGVFIKGRDLEELVARQPDLSPQVEAARDNMPMDWKAFRASVRDDDPVFLRVKVLACEQV